MTEFTALMQMSHTLEKQFNQIEMAKAYKTITEAMGPSEQLIAFVNFDGKLGEEIGLEGFDTFSLRTKHEVLMSKLNIDVLENMATEGFKDFIKKTRLWATGAGVAGLFIFGGPLFIALTAAGVAGIVMKHIDSLVLTHDAFESFSKAITKELTACKALVSGIPTSSSADSWEAFKTKAMAADEEVDKYDPTTETTAKFTKSGWNVNNLVTALNWAKHIESEFTLTRKAFDSKLSKFENIDNDAAKIMHSALVSATSVFRICENDLKTLSTEMKKVAKCFEVSDKK